MWLGSWTQVVVVVSCLVIQCSCDLKFAGWGQPCQIPDSTGVEVLEPKFECDAGRGLSCQVYQQGKLCGCSGALSYDRRSEECRRKMATACHIPKDKEESSRQNFNHKCHENAECVIYNRTLIGGKSSETERKKSGEAKPVCLCKQGYMATTDLTECLDPNGSALLQPPLPLVLVIAVGLHLLHRH